MSGWCFWPKHYYFHCVGETDSIAAAADGDKAFGLMSRQHQSAPNRQQLNNLPLSSSSVVPSRIGLRSGKTAVHLLLISVNRLQIFTQRWWTETHTSDWLKGNSAQSKKFIESNDDCCYVGLNCKLTFLQQMSSQIFLCSASSPWEGASDIAVFIPLCFRK